MDQRPADPRREVDEEDSSELALLWIYIGFTVGISFICSLLEAALLAVPRAALVARDTPGTRRLLVLKTSRIDDSLSAILTLNTVANTFGAVMVGSEAKHWAATAFGEGAVDLVAGVVAGLLTVVILTCSEIVPKTLGAVYATPLAGFVGHTVHLMTTLMSPVLFLTRTLTRLLTRGRRRDAISRAELGAAIALAASDGVLEGHEHRLHANLLRLEEIRISDVMTPRTVAVMVHADLTLGELVEQSDALPFSRLPVHDEDRDDVVGYVLQPELMRRAAQGEDRSRTMRELCREIWYVPEVVTMSAALRQFLQRREPLAMVTDEHGGISGLVTLEDLIETCLGVEIIDESDAFADMREVAARLRDQRLAELAQRTGGAGEGGADLSSA